MRGILILVLSLALQGCLVTSVPVFDETNSIPASQSPALKRIIAVWEETVSTESSPRALMTSGARVIEKDGMVVVEERSEGQNNYFALSPVGPRVAICVVHHRKIDAIAARHGVSVRTEGEQRERTMPEIIYADGSKDALFAFVVDAFRQGLLICQAASRAVRSLR